MSSVLISPRQWPRLTNYNGIVMTFLLRTLLALGFGLATAALL
jgi:hypothetical protein